jgi:hypothetical protein
VNCLGDLRLVRNHVTAIRAFVRQQTCHSGVPSVIRVLKETFAKIVAVARLREAQKLKTVCEHPVFRCNLNSHVQLWATMWTHWLWKRIA